MRPPKGEKIRSSIENGIAVIKFDNPKKGNALGAGIGDELLEALEWADGDPDVKVVILTGEGKFFTSGMDLTGIPKEGPVLADEGIERLGKTHRLLINTTKILIAAVNGPAAGYGTSSIALFDFVYSVPDAIFFMPFVKVGMCAEACSSVTFTRIMGRQKASALLLAGERMTPQEMDSAGLVTKILPKEGFLDEVMKIAQRIASSPPGSLEANKRLLMAPIREELLAANERECLELKERVKTNEPRDAMNAFEREQRERKASKL